MVHVHEIETIHVCYSILYQTSISFLNLAAPEINLATFDNTLLPFWFMRVSNLNNVGHDM